MSFLKRLKKTFLSFLGVPEKSRSTGNRRRRKSGSSTRIKRQTTRKRPKPESRKVTKVKSSPSPKKKKVSAKTVLKGKKTAIKKAGSPKAMPKKPEKERRIAVVTHYFPKAKAAALRIEAAEGIKIGDRIVIHSGDKKIPVTIKSLQINRIPVDEGRLGEEVGIALSREVRPEDPIYKALNRQKKI